MYSASRPTPKLDGQYTVFVTPRAGWPSYNPRHLIPTLDTFYDLYILQWEYLLSRSPQGKIMCFRKFNLQNSHVGKTGKIGLNHSLI